ALNCPDAELRFTYWFAPLNCRAPPTFPDVQVGPLTSVPPCPLPEESAAVDPAPSSSFQYPIKPGGGEFTLCAERYRTASPLKGAANDLVPPPALMDPVAATVPVAGLNHS